MNLEKLIAAAQEIDAACQEKERRTQHLKELAARARREKRSLTHEIVSQPTVFDLGDAIGRLRSALHEKGGDRP